jgi:Spy/CpxP family protein refolding chaperone
MKVSSIFLPLFAAGILASAQTTPAPAQTPTPAQNQAKSHHRVRQDMVQRLARRFNLTPDQQTKARQLFAKSREEMKALGPKLREERQAMRAAIKADNEQQIDQMTRQNAQLNAQARAIHAKTMAKFYQMLTPDQKAKFDQGRERRSM